MTSRHDFATRAMDYLSQAGELRPMAFDESRFRLVIGDGNAPTSFAYLGHAFREAAEHPEKTHETLRVLKRRLWSTAQSGPSTGKPAFGSVVPRLKDRAWFSAMRRQAELELGDDEETINEFMLPARVVNAELSAHLAYELPTSVMEIGADRLEAWQRSFDDLFSTALTNLAGRSSSGFECSAPGLYISNQQDGLDASRMLLTDEIAKLPLKGAPVAVAPSHDLLFITGAEDLVSLKQVAELAEESQATTRAYISFCFRLEVSSGQWQPFLPPKTTPAWAKFRLMQLQGFASACARQKEVLDALMESKGVNVQVGTVRAFRIASGDMFTSCAWTDGVEALLPKTDRIDFVRVSPDKNGKKTKVWSTSFDAALQELPELMKPTDDIPTRFHVAGFPTEAQLDALAAAHPMKS
jgi:hypothetical protein